MFYLKSKAQCVWYWETFEAMPWTSKLMEATVVLPPVFVALLARLDWGDGMAWRGFWTVMAAISWWNCAATLGQYVRGWVAQKRDVLPEPRAYPAKPRQSNLFLIGSGAMACLLILELVSHAGRHPNKQTETLALLFLLLFFQQLSEYPRGRADESPDLGLRVTPDGSAQKVDAAKGQRPQGLKPNHFAKTYGTAEAVPLSETDVFSIPTPDRRTPASPLPPSPFPPA